MSDWENQDNWEEQIHEMLEDVLGELTDLDDECKLVLTDIAAKVKNGKLTVAQALERYREHVLEHHFGGYKNVDEETMRLEVEVGGLIDVTDGFHTNMLIAGEVGIADAVIRISVHPGIVHGFEQFSASFGDVAMAIQSKAWFDITRLNMRERQALEWAAATAAKAMVSTN